MHVIVGRADTASSTLLQWENTHIESVVRAASTVTLNWHSANDLNCMQGRVKAWKCLSGKTVNTARNYLPLCRGTVMMPSVIYLPWDPYFEQFLLNIAGCNVPGLVMWFEKFVITSCLMMLTHVACEAILFDDFPPCALAILIKFPQCYKFLFVLLHRLLEDIRHAKWLVETFQIKCP